MITNVAALAKTPLRRAALDIAEAGLAAIDTETAVRRAVRMDGNALFVRDNRFLLDPEGGLFVVGVGKCSLEAGRALESILGKRLSGGIVVDVHEGSLGTIAAYAGTHPFPSEANILATEKIITLLSGLGERDFVLFVVSGGGSTLLCQPETKRCEDERSILECLFRAGATIQDINVVRKHLSNARGGFLAKYAYPARSASLIFSDVPGNDIAWVASGPTVLDTTTIADAENVLAAHNVEGSCGFRIPLLETPKDAKYFANVKNVLLVSNADALRAMTEKAEREGFTARVVSDEFTGEASAMGEAIAHTLKTVRGRHALLYGGETTVKVTRGSGKGGRNMELALSALPMLSEHELVLALASDGRDNSDYAGALCDTMTMKRANEAGLDPGTFVASHDSYGFFASTGDAIVTGDTGSNAADLIIALHEE